MLFLKILLPLLAQVNPIQNDEESFFSEEEFALLDEDPSQIYEIEWNEEDLDALEYVEETDISCQK